MSNIGGFCPGCGEAIERDCNSCPTCGRDLFPTGTTQPGVCAVSGETPHLTDFEIIRTLGRGGMGTVYEASQISMHRRVALKILGSHSSFSASERFEREAWIGGRLTHPHIVKVYTQGVEGDVAYLAMELVDGPSLHVVLQRARASRRTWSSSVQRTHIRRIVSMFIGVVDALECAHKHGVVHRDIKPHNLLVAPDDHLFLSDFGLARDARERALTRRGDVLGTIRYMSPEQLQPHRASLDNRTDIWSMGVSLYEAITLDLPFPGETDEAYIAAVSTGVSVPARLRSRAITRDLETVLMKCLDRDPGRRYSTAADLRDDLQRCLENRPVLARRPRIFIRAARFASRHRGSVATAAAAAIVASGAMVMGVQVRNQATEMLAGLSVRDVARDREQILRTLHEITTTPTLPERIQPEWGRLISIIQTAVRRDPHSELAQLALLASCGLESRTATFGLSGDPPSFEVHFMALFDPGIEAYCIADVESSWDNESWREVWSAKQSIHSPGPTPFAYNGAFDRRKAGVHNVRFRATRSIVEVPSPYDELGRRRSLLTRLSIVLGRPPGASGMISPARVADQWPLSRDRAIARSTAELGTYTVAMFDSLPSDFPHELALPGDHRSQLDIWRPEKVRLLRVSTPRGAERCWDQEIASMSRYELFKKWTEQPFTQSPIWIKPPSSFRLERCLPDSMAPDERVVTIVQVVGAGENIRLVREPGMMPIAAVATLTVATAHEPSLDFAYAAGDGYAWIDGMNAQVPVMGTTVSDFGHLTGVPDRRFLNLTDSRNDTIPLAKAWSSPRPLTNDPPDGLYNGQLVLTPSREIARLTKHLDRYLGETLVYDLPIEISTQQPNWFVKYQPPANRTSVK